MGQFSVEICLVAGSVLGGTQQEYVHIFPKSSLVAGGRSCGSWLPAVHPRNLPSAASQCGQQNLRAPDLARPVVVAAQEPGELLRANIGPRRDALAGLSPGSQFSPTLNLSYIIPTALDIDRCPGAGTY